MLVCSPAPLESGRPRGLFQVAREGETEPLGERVSVRSGLPREETQRMEEPRFLELPKKAGTHLGIRVEVPSLHSPKRTSWSVCPSAGTSDPTSQMVRFL